MTDHLPLFKGQPPLPDTLEDAHRVIGFLAEASSGLGHRSARWVSLWSAATRRRMVRKAATSRRTPHLSTKTHLPNRLWKAPAFSQLRKNH